MPRRAPRRRRRIGWIVAAAAVVVIAAIWTAVHVSADRAFEEASSVLTAAQRDSDAATAELRHRTEDAAGAAEVGRVIGEASSTAEDLVDAAARTDLGAAVAAAADAVGAAESALQEPVSADEIDKPLWTWELLSATPRMTADAAELADRADGLRASQVAVETADAAMLDAARRLYASVPASAAGLEQANVSARAIVLLDLREAAEAAAGQTGLGTGAANAFTRYASTAANLKQSAQAELAEKAGPLFATRLEIEEYARSIAGGVVLDFDWAPIVAGVGGSDGMGGTATWAVARGGFSTITLSHSVAENWPSADAMALVAHEVGHAITSKCSDLFDSESAAANEAWATAWAISLGHDALGSGVQAYGYPPQSLIETAATCR